MGKRTLSTDTYHAVRQQATRGGSRDATADAEERVKRGEGIDPLVDPKGPDHLGPIRRSLPRFEKMGDLWELTRGVPMAEETLLDTTGSMQENIVKAFEVLPLSYEMVTSGSKPVLYKYDPQIATAIFGDVEDNTQRGKPVLCRSQFEMDEKIAVQMTHLVPSRLGFGNGKEDPQFGLFGAAYLTDAFINRYGLKYYHFTVSDEPVVETIAMRWLKAIFGDEVLDSVKENGYDFDVQNLSDTAKVVMDLQAKAHAFFLMVGDRREVKSQWSDLYGDDHFVMLPEGTTDSLHYIKATIIGLTEGVLDLRSAHEFLQEHGAGADAASQILRAVAHIPLRAQTLFPNFDKLPMAGDLFRDKTDLWPVDASEIHSATPVEVDDDENSSGGPKWL